MGGQQRSVGLGKDTSLGLGLRVSPSLKETAVGLTYRAQCPSLDRQHLKDRDQVFIQCCLAHWKEP